MDLFQVVKELAAGGFATFLVAILVAGKYGVWVWGHHYTDMCKEKDAIIAYERAEKEEWRQLAWETKHLTEKSVRVAEKAVSQ